MQLHVNASLLNLKVTFSGLILVQYFLLLTQRVCLAFIDFFVNAYVLDILHKLPSKGKVALACSEISILSQMLEMSPVLRDDALNTRLIYLIQHTIDARYRYI